MDPVMPSEAKALYAKTLVDVLKVRFTSLGDLVDKLANLSQQARKEADGVVADGYAEGLAVGKQIAYGEAAKALKSILDGE